MANLKIIEKDGRVFEVSDITFDEVKQLVSTNGNGHGRAVHRPIIPMGTAKRRPDYQGLRDSLSESAKKFFKLLSENPNGISNDHLADKLGFRTSNQIGGVTGGGIGKQAPKFNVATTDLYTIEVSRDANGRRVLYKPGPEIEKVL